MKVKTKMHGKWCRRFIGTGVDIQSRREISEVVAEAEMYKDGLVE